MPLKSLLLCVAMLAPLSAVADVRWDSPQVGNPILPGYYADPSLVQHEGRFFLYATLDPWGGRTLGCWESPDFKHWEYRELNWPTKEACTSPTSKGAMVWAPSVIRAPSGRFLMYVSVGNEVWVGAADHPLGPWSDANGGEPLIPETYRPGYHMIDAEAFVDDDGSIYLHWGSGWGWVNGKCFAVKLEADGVGFVGEPVDVTPTNYFEAPHMIKHDGRYYLSYSQGVTISDTYQVHYAVGDSPLGPFVEAANSPILVTDHARNVVSPGHHTLFTYRDRHYILYHRHRVPWVEREAYRQICVDEIRFTPDGLMEKITPSHTAPAFVHGRNAGRLAAVASASSELDATYAASRVVDGNYATRWAAAAEATGGWLQLDLGSAQSVGRVEVRFEYAWKPVRFALKSSVDGRTWTTIADHREEAFTGSPFMARVGVQTRFLRVEYADGSKADEMSAWEIAAYSDRHDTRSP
jgi:hypothetical protein